MLIDCGIHSSVPGGSAKMDAIVADIALQTSFIDVVVVTHEHIDHVSAFLSASEHFARITFGDVWFAWTENPADPQARALDTYKQQALAALEATAARLDRVSGDGGQLDGLKQGLDSVLGFQFGAKGERVRAARDAAKAKATGKVVYREPTDPPISAIAGLPNVRIYVLGPPRDAKLLGLTQQVSEMYGAAGGSGWQAERALTSAFEAQSGAAREDFAAPFERDVGADLKAIAAATADASQRDLPAVAAFAAEHYFTPRRAQTAASRSRQRAKPADAQAPDQTWRRIDYDWLGISADLAMQLDDKTNNTSLVLAFEFIDSGRVLLFAADAQVGNWLSWQDTSWTVGTKTVTGPDLLARTVYYKVGHHGSHNATLRAKGLELMNSPDLSAFIPTNEHDAKAVGWGAMPFNGLLDALKAHCGGRVFRADDPWIVTGVPAAPGFATPGGSIKAIRCQPGMWVEVEIA
eukprot:gene19661-20117_t